MLRIKWTEKISNEDVTMSW